MGASKRIPLFATLLTLAAAFGPLPVLADGEQELAKQSQNPVGDVVSLPFENNVLFGIGPSGSHAYLLNLKPVYPVRLGKLNLINRLILPVIYAEGQDITLTEEQSLLLGFGGEVRLGNGSAFGLGDTTYQAFFSPAEPGKLIWGVGPALVLPTATESRFASDKWSAGISAVALAMPGRWVVGMLVQNVWSTVDGRQVRWGEVFRSGELPRLSHADVDRLDSLGVPTVVNFLTPAEIAQRGEDRLPEGVREVAEPIAGAEDELVLVVLEARKTGDFSAIPPELNADIHRLLVKDAREEYAALLRAAADPAKRPLVFHCSHGVHRTGTAAAILLSALGVPWETVREDYLLSNVYRADEIDRRLAELRDLAANNQGLPPGSVDTSNMEAFYRLQGA